MHRFRILHATTALLAFAFVAISAAPPAHAAGTDDYLQELGTWQHQREENLRSRDGWLTLVGLFLLSQGDNSFGSAADNKLVFPAKAPAHAGVLHVAGDQVQIEAAADAGITTEDQPVTRMTLRPDSDENPTVLSMGTFTFFVIARGEQLFVRLKDSESPALAEFRGIDRFPASPTWRIEARFEPYNPPHKITVPNVLGTSFDETSPGAVVFELNGKTYRLDPVGEPDQSLFLIFGDQTNGPVTYGGGRFLSADPPGPDGKVILDFNRAYNPPCAFTPYATCPLPPRQNKLAVRIEAGEKKYGRGH